MLLGDPSTKLASTYSKPNIPQVWMEQTTSKTITVDKYFI
jgi:hypothetical protein